MKKKFDIYLKILPGTSHNILKYSSLHNNNNNNKHRTILGNKLENMNFE